MLAFKQESSHEKVRWGILSTAKIGTKKVIPAMQSSQCCDILAIASRNLEKAHAAAKRLDIPHAFGSYEELLASNDIDAVYNPLLNHLHVSWSIKVLEAGKHVLCEKPIGLSVAEARELLTEAQKHPDLKIMEAFMYRHHPQWQRMKQLVNEGRFGELRTIHSFFSYYKEIIFDICDQYTIQGDLFSLAVLNDTEVPTPLVDAVKNMKVIEAIIESAKSGTWVRNTTG